MRSGDEPSSARSALRMRRALAGFGLASALTGVVVFVLADRPGWAVPFGVIALIATADLVVVQRHLRQGPHYQPGPDVPPYRPVGDEPRPRPAGRRVPQRTRAREYLVLMGLCLGLLLIGWILLPPISTTAAIVVSVIALVIPPIAAIVANVGATPGRRDDPDGH